MENKQIITLAYELAKSKYAKKAFSFNDLWNDLIKKAKLDAEEIKQAGHVYTSMLQDQRFIFVGNNEWKIREFLTQKKQEQCANALYGFKLEAEEEGVEVKEAKKKKRLEALAAKEEAEQATYYDETDLETVYQETASSLDDEDEGQDSTDIEEQKPESEEDEE